MAALGKGDGALGRWTCRLGRRRRVVAVRETSILRGRAGVSSCPEPLCELEEGALPIAGLMTDRSLATVVREIRDSVFWIFEPEGGCRWCGGTGGE